MSSTPRTGKRKSESTSTPLSISSSGVAFHRLAPLAAPRFAIRTPQSKVDTDASLRNQAETMKRLRIRDMDNSDDDWGVIEDNSSESDCDLSGSYTVPRKKLFTARLSALSRKTVSPSPLANILPQKGTSMDEVAAAVSPGGHITKRRARSRPVSQELLESAHHTPSPQAPSYTHPSRISPPKSAPVTFPSVPRNRFSVISTTASPIRGSSIPRRRLTGSSSPNPLHKPRTLGGPSSPRGPVNRLASGSSASLFFGPSIPQSPTNTRPRTSTTTTSSAQSAATAARLRAQPTQPFVLNRHSYAGPGSATMTPFPWKLRTTQYIPSPDSSPPSHRGGHSILDDDDDLFFEPCGPPETSFVFSVTGSPSPRSNKGKEMLPLKYKPRDSGVALSDDEDVSSSGNPFLSAIPRNSISGSSSLYSDAGDDLITPIMPSTDSGWPNRVVIGGLDDGDRHYDGLDADSFIMRTLAAGNKPTVEEHKRPPGTPVKKIKTTYLGGNRPWQSAVANKVGFHFGDLGLEAVGQAGPGGGGKSKNRPRKSLPAAFPHLGEGGLVANHAKMTLNGSDSEEDEENNSPSSRRDGKYMGLGLGQPPAAGPVSRTRLLMRRSSSGTFSSGSETSVATPTHRKDWPLLSRSAIQGSSYTSDSRSSSNSSVITANSPTFTRGALQLAGKRTVSPLVKTDDEPAAKGKLGRFERDFVEIDEIGSGEFGKVMKVRAKNGAEDQVWAVKRSKPFEGPRHRLRLREEVDILRHLAQAAAADRKGYSNVLAYIDSWEQDDTLFIQTELCELGNFARFLWEYGRTFQRLDEARVWKIFVDLSNGVRFIHDAGIIHLDLKPANVFLTREGRFKIGDFGMASQWPRRSGGSPMGLGVGGFEREGDKVYLAREVLQGTYGQAADMFSFGMMMLETATNIVVPDQGDDWHRLRQEDFSRVELGGTSPELLGLIKGMMRMDPGKRTDAQTVCAHPVIARARAAMERLREEAVRNDTSMFAASPLASIGAGFLEEILGRGVGLGLGVRRDEAMDTGP